MKVVNISVSNHYGNPTASVSLCDDNSTAVTITCTPEESYELLSVGLRLFEARQQEIAKSIADMKPIALMPPSVEEAEFAEVSPPPPPPTPVDLEDDIPF